MDRKLILILEWHDAYLFVYLKTIPYQSIDRE
jgi:hypothetical protein